MRHTAGGGGFGANEAHAGGLALTSPSLFASKIEAESSHRTVLEGGARGGAKGWVPLVPHKGDGGSC